MNPTEFAFLADLLKRRSGLAIGPDKAYLIDSRLLPLARKLGFAGLQDLVHRLRAGGSEALAVAVTEAMTTNETFFYRDKTPFDQLHDLVLPDLVKARAAVQRLRIWCAACSTGQEPYSIAMLFADRWPQLASWRIEIVATDLSKEVLDKARAGLYSQFEVQRGLPIQQLVKHFTKEGDLWRIAERHRRAIDFRPLNLLETFAGLGTFDVIFCRNVLIYFDPPTKTQVMAKLAASLAPDGRVVLGAAETLLGLTQALKPVAGARGLYARADAPGAAGLRAAG